MFGRILFFIILASVRTSCYQNKSAHLKYETLLLARVEDPSYKKWIKPNTTNDEPLLVNVSINLHNFATVNDLYSDYTFQLFLDMEWFDPRLEIEEIDSQHFDISIEGEHWYLDRIWSPSIYVTNNQEPGTFDLDEVSPIMVLIKPNGYVMLRKRKMLRIYCSMDFRNYPFDEQTCTVHFESNALTIEHLIFKWSSTKPFAKSKSFTTIGFDMVKHYLEEQNVTYIKGNSFSRVSATFILKREFFFYLLDMYFPSTIIIITSWSSFWLEISSPPARVSLGVTTMLTLVTTLKNARAQLPRISYVNAFDIWAIVCIFFIFASLVEFAWVNYKYNTDKRRKKKRKRRKSKKRLSINSFASSNYSNDITITSLMSQSTIQSLNSRDKTKIRDQSSVPNFQSYDCHTPSTLEPISNSQIYMRRASSQVRFSFPNESSQSSSLPSTFSLPNIIPNENSVPTSPTLFTNNIDNEKKMTPQDIANEIDRKCRFIFPISFLLFNVVYWTVLLIT